MISSRIGRTAALLFAGILIGLLGYWFIPWPEAGGSSNSDREPSSSGQPVARAPGAETAGLVAATPNPVAPKNPLAMQIDEILAKFNAGGMTREQALQALAELAKTTESMDPVLAARTLMAFLDSGKNAPTGLGFIVGEGGVLSESPSVRIAALDLLGRTGSPESPRYAEQVMDTTGIADEYAVALRNLAWAGGDARPIRDRFSGMLNRDEWIANPTPGFMEAFDVAVATGGSRMVREVGAVVLGPDDLADAGSAPLNRPAFIALDRLMIRDPSAVVETFQQDPGFLSWAPNQRASVLSRIDVRDPGQRALLESYLTGAAHGPGEIEYFAKIFPNVNGLDGNRMVTENDEVRNVATMDRATLDALKEWQNDPRFQDAAPVIKQITDRLGGFVRD